jgi:hypothetical protein
MKKIEIKHFMLLSIALVLAAVILPAGWFALVCIYFMSIYTLIWHINHRPEYKWVNAIIKLF